MIIVPDTRVSLIGSVGLFAGIIALAFLIFS